MEGSRRSPILLCLALGALAAAPAAADTAVDPECDSPPGRLILVRHAHKQDESLDSPLSKCGWRQAVDILHEFGDLSIDTIIVSSRVRTRQTATPLAEYLELEPLEVPDDPFAEKLIERLCASVPGDTVLVVGHAYTLPAVFESFGRRDPGFNYAESFDFQPASRGKRGRKRRPSTRCLGRPPLGTLR